MVTIATSREKDGQVYKDAPREITSSKALSQLIEFEWEFGGKTVFVSKTAVMVVTMVMGCKDSTLIEGTEEEMAPFLTAVGCCAIVRNEAPGMTIPNDAKRTFKNSPEMAEHAAQIIQGTSTGKGICLLMLNIDDEDFISKSSKLPLKDLLALVEMCVFENASNDDILSLVA